MSVAGKRRFRSVIEAAIQSKPNIKEITAVTFRNDAAAILESVVAEWNESDILMALERQGFEATAYQSTLRSLAEVARSRRSERLAGSFHKSDESNQDD